MGNTLATGLEMKKRSECGCPAYGGGGCAIPEGGDVVVGGVGKVYSVMSSKF